MKDTFNLRNNDGHVLPASAACSLDVFQTGKEVEDKSKETVSAVQRTELNAEVAKPTSPVSVADQMVSMLWASASSPTKNAMNTQCSPEGALNTNNLGRESRTHDNSEEISVRDESEGNATMLGDDLFDEIIEEITVEENNESNDKIIVDTTDKCFGTESFIEIEISQNAAEYDDCSYDEITANDSEYDEKTVEEDLQHDHESDAECKNVQEVKEEADNHCNLHQLCTGVHEDADCCFDREVHEILNPPKNDQKQTSAFDKYFQETPKLTSPTISSTLSSQSMKNNDGYERSSKVEMLNPGIIRSPTLGAKFAEKLKLVDGPKSFPPPNSPPLLAQSCERPKTKTASPDSKISTDHPEGAILETFEPRATLELTSKNTSRLDGKLNNVSVGGKGDEALADEIISLVKEAGAMQNKVELAERIAFLLTSHSNNFSKISTINATETIETQAPKTNPSPKSVKPQIPLRKSKRQATSYSSTEKDFDLPSLKQIRKGAKTHSDCNRHMIDPEQTENGNTKQPSIGESKQKLTRKQNIKPIFDVANKDVNPDEIMARIWSKKPNRDMDMPKVSPVFSGPSASATAQTQKTMPRKLGNRLKMFESPTSFEPSMKTDLGPQFDSTNQRLNVDRETLRRISSFQRLWKLKHPRREIVHASKAKAFSSGITKNKSSENLGKSDSSFLACINSLDTIDQDSKVATEAAHDSDSNNDLSNRCHFYSLKDLETGNFDGGIVDMERWEEFLSDTSFFEQFGCTKKDFFAQPKWKRDKQKRKVRVAF